MTYLRPNQPFIVDTGASNTGTETVLLQVQGGQGKVVAYFSKSEPEHNYCITRKELRAVIKAVEHFPNICMGRNSSSKLIRASEVACELQKSRKPDYVVDSKASGISFYMEHSTTMKSY